MMINFIGITTDNRMETGTEIENIDIVGYQWFWVDFSNPTEEEVIHLSSTFHFHPLAIEDCLHRLQRPKLDYYDDYTFYVTHFFAMGTRWQFIRVFILTIQHCYASGYATCC